MLLCPKFFIFKKLKKYPKISNLDPFRTFFETFWEKKFRTQKPRCIENPTIICIDGLFNGKFCKSGKNKKISKVEIYFFNRNLFFNQIWSSFNEMVEIEALNNWKTSYMIHCISYLDIHEIDICSQHQFTKSLISQNVLYKIAHLVHFILRNQLSINLYQYNFLKKFGPRW